MAMSVMEVGPPGSPGRPGISNHRKLRWSRARVVSVAVNGSLSAGQVGDEKTNVSEPLVKRRKSTRMASKPGRARCSGRPGGLAMVGRLIRSQGVGLWCRPDGARRRGGVSLSQALAWKRRTCRPDAVGQWKWSLDGPLVAKGRTASGKHRKWQSTEAGHRGGPARSSWEGPVMGLEPRGRAGQVTRRSTLLRGRS
jgi:hypothetical protein